MGSGRGVVLAAWTALVVLAAPVAAIEPTDSVHGIEAAALATLDQSTEVTTGWQPLFAGTDDVVAGQNPIIRFSAVAYEVAQPLPGLAATVPSVSPIDVAQTGEPSYYAGQSAVTFALLQAAVPASGVEGTAVEYAIYWRWPGLPTQPPNPEANGDATADATNSFSVGMLNGEVFTTFTQSDGAELVEYAAGSLAVFEFVADDAYNLMIAIPGVPEAVWGSALNAATTERSDFAIHIVSETVPGVVPRILTEQMSVGDQADRWDEILDDSRTVADLVPAGIPAEPVVTSDPTGIPANPPTEVEVQADGSTSTTTTGGSLWQWMVGVLVGVGVVALLLRLVVFKPPRQTHLRPSKSWQALGHGVDSSRAQAVARRWREGGAEVIDGHVVGNVEQWERAISEFDMQVTAHDWLHGVVRASFGEVEPRARAGSVEVFDLEIRSEARHPMQAYTSEWEEYSMEAGSVPGIDLETGTIRLIPFETRAAKLPVSPPPEPDPQPRTDEDRQREGEAMLGGQDRNMDKHGRPV